MTILDLALSDANDGTNATTTVNSESDRRLSEQKANLLADYDRPGLRLFLVGFIVLFFELACIRWFAASVLFLQFFTNIILMACFLGMSCGCLAARSRRNWLVMFPRLALCVFSLAILTLAAFNFWDGLSVDVGNQSSPQRVFFGTESHNPDVAQFVIPIELIASVFFLLIALLFVGLGQVLGRAFDACPNRVRAYTLNIVGSLLGIVGFTAISFLHSPPLIWFLICFLGIALLLFLDGCLERIHIFALTLILIVVGLFGMSLDSDREYRWSPYYAVVHQKSNGSISVNTIGFQYMVPFESGGSVYSLVHLLQKHSGGKPFQDVLIIGAGSGNDVAHALRYDVERVDAVEIDPVIQEIGSEYHPDRPYDDPRVHVTIDDGRHFLRSTDRKYDLVIYALVDSLILHSSYTNIRLESFLFTEQAFEDVKHVLKPNGVVAMYNLFRQDWIIERAAKMAEQTFGNSPLVISLPYREEIGSNDFHSAFTVILSGNNQHLKQAFKEYGSFWLNSVPPENLQANGFQVHPETLPSVESKKWKRIAPASLLANETYPPSTTDDWPFFYLRKPMIPSLNIRSVMLLGVLGLGLVFCFRPRGRSVWNSRMFFLGAGFMLIETKAVVHLALLFGSTWLVNSGVFFTVLLLILLGNLFVLAWPSTHLKWHYAGLLVFLALNALIPLETFLGGGFIWRIVVPCLLVFLPIFFAAVVFAQSFKDTVDPDQAFGANIAGAVVGGLSECCSMLLGFRYLIFVAIAFYLLSMFNSATKAIAKK